MCDGAIWFLALLERYSKSWVLVINLWQGQGCKLHYGISETEEHLGLCRAREISTVSKGSRDDSEGGEMLINSASVCYQKGAQFLITSLLI